MRELKPSVVEGWDIERQEFRDAMEAGRLVKLVTECTNVCTLNCPGCFTVKVEEGTDPSASLGKKRLANEMSPELRIDLLREAVNLGARSVDIVGAGEPMIDPSIRSFVTTAADEGVHVNVFTHGAHSELLDESNVSWWLNRPVSFFIKLWSQDPEVNEAMVRPKGSLKGNYTKSRDEAIRNLIAAGFNRGREFEFDGRTYRSTRIGADILVTQANLAEIPALFRFCRQNNIQPIIKNYIPEGPTRIDIMSGAFGSLPLEEQRDLRDQRVGYQEIERLRRELEVIDAQEFGNQPLGNFYLGSTFCTQSAASLYVPISGKVYSCVGTHENYGPYEPDKGMLARVLAERRERVGFGCFPRLEVVQAASEPLSDAEKAILSQV